MSPNPILLIGGSGVVGRWTARYLREAHHDAPLLIGGRDLGRAEEAAAEIGHAQGVMLDLATGDLGVGERPVSAVAVFFTDERIAGLRFAQSRGVPHVSISSGLHEIGPEVAAYIHTPKASPVVLGTEWLVGATTVPTLQFAKAFGRVHDIAIGALLDEQDAFGPAAAADLERQTKTLPAALARRDGAYRWRVGDDAKASFRAVDGTEMEATALSPYDVVGLATATGRAKRSIQSRAGGELHPPPRGADVDRDRDRAHGGGSRGPTASHPPCDRPSRRTDAADGARGRHASRTAHRTRWQSASPGWTLFPVPAARTHRILRPPRAHWRSDPEVRAAVTFDARRLQPGEPPPGLELVTDDMRRTVAMPAPPSFSARRRQSDHASSRSPSASTGVR
jgi:hypothetical protein